jgi:putative glutamine amidotransferase
MHPIRLAENSNLINLTGISVQDTPYVLSSHHQTVGELEEGWTVTGTSLDGKGIEAIEHEKCPHVIGIQFHPDYHTLWDENLRLRFAPEDEEKRYLQVLKSNPPSIDFHKKLWSGSTEDSLSLKQGGIRHLDRSLPY